MCHPTLRNNRVVKSLLLFLLISSMPLLSMEQSDSAGATQKNSLELLPLFQSCSYYWYGSELDSVSAVYREKNGEWHNALAPVFSKESGVYRGSIVNLKESSDYEFRLLEKEKQEIVSGNFRTWDSEIKIARTVVLNHENFDNSITIQAKGEPDGWIRYVAAPGFVFKSTSSRAPIILREAEYILLEGLTVQGGDKYAVVVEGSKYVRIRNCDISGWGRIGQQRFDLDGKYYDADGKAINYDGGIIIRRSHGTVVERCYIHDPRNTANPWRYSHPAGPAGLVVSSPTSTVLRYNDIIGSDEHRWNDAIESTANFNRDGGFNHDADIYGNMIAFCNDDGIELDGGQQNVRCFFNKFEGTYCGISIQGCMVGPSYVFGNLIVNPGDIFGSTGRVLKTSSSQSGKNAVSFVFNNTFVDESCEINFQPYLKLVCKNNIFAGNACIVGLEESPNSVLSHNLLEFQVPNENPTCINGNLAGNPGFVDREAGVYTLRSSSPGIGKGIPVNNLATSTHGKVDLGAFPYGTTDYLPYRPVPIRLDKKQLIFSLSDKKTSPDQNVKVMVDGINTAVNYAIRQNDSFDWFEVTPASGTLKSGDKCVLSVKLRPERMKQHRFYRGIFLLRLANGFSRPVTIYADTNNISERELVKNCISSLWINAWQPDGGKFYEVIDDVQLNGEKAVVMSGSQGENPSEYLFDLTEDGKYFIMLKIRSEMPLGKHDSVCFSINGDCMQDAHVNSSRTTWGWSFLYPGHKRQLRSFDLKKGRNRLQIAPREPIYLNAIVITENPTLFGY